MMGIHIVFLFLLKNIDGGYWLVSPHQGGSNENLQSIVLSRNKKYNVYHCKPHFYYTKVEFKGVKLYRYVSVTYKVMI